MFQMSPYRPPRNTIPHHGMKIVRPKEKLQKGVKTRACDFIILYENVSGRVMALKNIDENIIEVIKLQGKDKAGLTKVVLAPNYPLHKMTSTDFLVLPWGIRPNTWAPPGVPGNLGPAIWIQTPNGPVKLTWDGDKFTSPNLNIEIVNDEWCMTGEVTTCFTSCNISCNSDGFPDGYKFLKSTGPNAYFEIVKIDEHQDIEGRTSHYTLLVELLDQKNLIVQQ